MPNHSLIEADFRSGPVAGRAVLRDGEPVEIDVRFSDGEPGEGLHATATPDREALRRLRDSEAGPGEDRTIRLAFESPGNPRPEGRQRDAALATHLGFAVATAVLQADPSLEDDAAAIARLRAGLDALADLYAGPMLIDDTRMRVITAEAEARNGNLGVARALMTGALESRVGVYRDRFAPEFSGHR